MERDIELLPSLKANLSQSTAKIRREWAVEIIRKDLDILNYLCILETENKAAIRFSWLLSELALLSPRFLYVRLPELFEFSKNENNSWFQQSFPMYWLLCGVPEKNESEGFDLLLGFMMDVNVNSMIKLRSLKVLEVLSLQYPGLKPELLLILKDVKGIAKGSLLKRINSSSIRHQF